MKSKQPTVAISRLFGRGQQVGCYCRKTDVPIKNNNTETYGTIIVAPLTISFRRSGCPPSDPYIRNLVIPMVNKSEMVTVIIHPSVDILTPSPPVAKN